MADNNIEGGEGGGGGISNANPDKDEHADFNKGQAVEELASAAHHQLDKQLAGAGNGRPQQSIAANTGMGNVQQQEMMGVATQRPLPFDQHYDKIADLLAIKNGLPPHMFDQQELLYQQLEEMTPNLVRSMARSSSIFEGVPDDAVTNRINIFRQRDRENRLYAFI